jgi:glucose/arabinose dehydrogenase
MSGKHAVRAELGASLALAILSPSAHLCAQAAWRAELVASGFDRPTCIAQPPKEKSKFAVGEQRGLIRMVENGAILPTPLIDLTPVVIDESEDGLVALVFHPEYERTGWFYVNYATAQDRCEIARFTVPQPASYVADPASKLLMVPVLTGPIAFHKGGALEFGPDGKLYVGIGDLRKEFVSEGCVAQAGDSLLGKLLRLEPDGSIPSDNPFVGNPHVRDEIWAFGLRQPFRMAFDPYNGAMYIGDVGNILFDEIDFLPPGHPGGANFGWQIEEASVCTGSVLCGPSLCGSPAFEAPIVEVPHHGPALCIIGGEVYGGSAIPEMRGDYFFADNSFGGIWKMVHSAGSGVQLQSLTADLDPPGPERIDRPVDFTADHAGELLVVDLGSAAAPVGQVYKIVPEAPLTPLAASASLAAGAVQPLWLSAGATQGGRVFVILGTISATTPGIPYGGWVLPVTPDAYFWHVLDPHNGIVVPTQGWLDGTGSASAVVKVPSGLPRGLAGMTLHHAFAVVAGGPSPAITFVSNPAGLTLVP